MRVLINAILPTFLITSCKNNVTSSEPTIRGTFNKVYETLTFPNEDFSVRFVFLDKDLYCEE